LKVRSSIALNKIYTQKQKTRDMMKVEQIRTADDVERYIDGCLNDFEAGVSTKDETLVHLAELVAHVYVKAKQIGEK